MLAQGEELSVTRTRSRITGSPVDSKFVIYEQGRINIVSDPVTESPDDRLADSPPDSRFR